MRPAESEEVACLTAWSSVEMAGRGASEEEEVSPEAKAVSTPLVPSMAAAAEEEEEDWWSSFMSMGGVGG